MKIHVSLLPLALLLPLAACSKTEAGHGDAADAAKAAANEASAKLESTDLSKLAPEELKKSATAAIDELRTELMNVKDVQGAKALVSKHQPKLDQLVALKDKLGANLDKAGIQKLIDDVTAKLSSNPEVMGAIQPLVDKLKALIA
jgi:hypothetical protein